MRFIRRFFEGYSRCLYVNTRIGGREKDEACTKDFADQIDARFENRAVRCAGIGSE